MCSAAVKRVEMGAKTSSIATLGSLDTSKDKIDADLTLLQAKQLEWAQQVPLSERIKLLQEIHRNLVKYADELAEQDIRARHIPAGHWEEGMSLSAAGITGRLINLMIESLTAIADHGVPDIYNAAKEVDGRVILDVYPRNLKEKIQSSGLQAQVHLLHGTTLNELKHYQAQYYQNADYQGGVSLVMGAGNGSWLNFFDIFQKLIVEKKVVLFKVHPVLQYMADFGKKIFAPFIEKGYLRIVSGGAEVGNYLTHHPLVDDIHMTGSDKTFDAIVYGVGDVGLRNKAFDLRQMTKPITGELGNVTPIIVVPGDWRETDFDYHADLILTCLGLNNSYACCAGRVIILPKNWSGSKKLVEKISAKMQAVQQPVNYYPGTKETFEDILSSYPNCELTGVYSSKEQSWVFVKNLEPNKDECAFKREFWTSFIAQVNIDAQSTAEYLHKAVEFSNEKLWGTLTATMIIDEKTKQALARDLKQAIDQLRYGTVAINAYPGFSFGVGLTPWGGYPGAKMNDIQSGNCIVSVPLMLSQVEKSVLIAPFIMKPKPFWFISRKNTRKIYKNFGQFMLTNKWRDCFRLLISLIF